MKFVKYLLLIFTLSNSVSAKDYAIEVIIFVNQEGLQQNAEIYDPGIILPVPKEGLSLFELKDEFEASHISQQSEYIESDNELSPWRLIEPENFILSSQARKLGNSSNYQVLNHFAWRQPAVDRANSQPILINAGFDYSGIYPERSLQQIEFSDTDFGLEDEQMTGVWELEGTINVVITRYIHFYTDLVYRAERNNPPYENDNLQPQQVLVDYEIKSHRKMKSRELNYIDHPIVGILVEVTPIDDEN